MWRPSASVVVKAGAGLVRPRMLSAGAELAPRVLQRDAARSISLTSSRCASYRRSGEPSRQPQQQELSPEEIRRQLEERLFRPISLRGQPQKSAPSVYQRFGGPSNSGGSGGSGRSRFSSRPPILILVLLGGAGVYYVVHLEKVPETGRWRFIDVSPEQEHEMGEQTFRQTLQEYRGKILPSSHPYSKQVRAVASRIVAALDKAVEHQPHHTRGDSGLDHHSHGPEGGIQYGSTSGLSTPSNSASQTRKTNWEVFVIDDPKQKNAFVLPGGKIFVFTGILPVCQNADGLATVLGHEVAHQVARHSAEKMSGYKVLLFGAFVLEMFGLDIGLSRAALTLLLSLPNSRKTELEADWLGLRIMSRACFDPTEASKLWTRMSQEDGSSSGGLLQNAQAILSTHPVSSQRIKNMQEWLPDALQTRQDANCPTPQNVRGFRDAASDYLPSQSGYSPF
ncbi:hypothetical protein BCV70DRAFT_199724 [Testicularia cyperi]|uniref:Peptidase M48 domain-containing protein n=1 Tax=Testicularia cyperi TaxID=1882483 RepID=A0A317XQA4_9BASI|nr:hypothetical protein BCV70DRAFT_199724 [Testicularia cyperi]